MRSARQRWWRLALGLVAASALVIGVAALTCGGEPVAAVHPAAARDAKRVAPEVASVAGRVRRTGALPPSFAATLPEGRDRDLGDLAAARDREVQGDGGIVELRDDAAPSSGPAETVELTAHVAGGTCKTVELRSDDAAGVLLAADRCDGSDAVLLDVAPGTYQLCFDGTTCISVTVIPGTANQTITMHRRR